MRKAQKEQAEGFIKLLEQAHEEIKVNIEKGNLQPVLVTLADCQDGAIAMGNLIEASEGEGFVTISYLEKYCEAVFQIHESILAGDSVDANKIVKKLKKGLIQIENSVRNDIKVRKEVVFFPYKASMWDSLESVYLAAKEDPDCDAYCVPIPYFDRNADGSLGQMHYEGNEYPENIEVIDWRSYKLEERRPNVIYIHNPYDACNRVTCVHPIFFSSNLKKYTEKLVYIPYFVLQEVEPDDQNTIDKMKLFCFLPGVINADKVIVQSEKMRQIYINEYEKAARANGIDTDRKQLEEKFLGTGSPKFDKVLNTRKEDLEIPKEWLKIIQKPDGSFKKIIFYNTSISALLRHEEQMLVKMKSVFKIFKENQAEVALLWRPHPLIPSTIKSMRPQLWEEYRKIVEEYKAEGWGIYDDTADMDRAVVLSDAYYGDHSSVVELVKKAGKLVLIQNSDVETGNVFKNVSLSLGIEINQEIWAAVDNFNGIVKVSTAGRMEYIYRFPEHPVWKKHLFGKTLLYNCKLFFMPYESKNMAVYNLKSGKCESVILPETDTENSLRYADMHIWNHFLYLFPKCEKYILQLDLDTYSVRKIEEPIRYMIEQKLQYNDIAFLEYSISISENVATMFCYAGKQILEFDMDTLQYNVIDMAIIEGNCLCGIRKQNLFYFCDSRKICVFNRDTSQTEWSTKTECEKEFLAYYRKEENLVFFPFRGEDLLILNRGNFREKRIKAGFSREYMEKAGKRVKVQDFIVRDGILFFTRFSNAAYCLNLNNTKCVRASLQLAEKDIKMCRIQLEKDLNAFSDVIEGEELGIGELIGWLIQDKGNV